MSIPATLPFSVEINPYTKTIVVTIHSNKGGVGKTAFTTMLAYYLAWLGYRIILVDMCDGHNLSNNCGFEMSRGDRDLYSIDNILAETQVGFVAQCLEPTRWMLPNPDGTFRPDPVNDRISLVPGHPDLSLREMEGLKPGGRLRLRKALEGATNGWHFVLIDGPPSKGHLPHVAWAASDLGLAISPGYLNEVEGTLKSLAEILAWREDLGVPHLDVAGCVVNMYRSDRREQVESVADLKRGLGPDRVWDDVPLPDREYIRRLVTHRDVLSFGALGMPGSGVGKRKDRAEWDLAMGRIARRFLRTASVPEPAHLTQFLAAAA